MPTLLTSQVFFEFFRNLLVSDVAAALTLTLSMDREGSEVDTETARMLIPLPHPCASGVLFASGYTGVRAMAAL
jgi:hypothetical protein